ncbi:hypothetical protein [Streptomyces massasporeus]
MTSEDGRPGRMKYVPLVLRPYRFAGLMGEERIVAACGEAGQ